MEVTAKRKPSASPSLDSPSPPPSFKMLRNVDDFDLKMGTKLSRSALKNVKKAYRVSGRPFSQS